MDFYPLSGGEGELPVPAFRILDRLITTGEIERFRNDTKQQPYDWANAAGADPREPAWVDLDTALRFASWAGGRLPCAAELWVAARGAAIEIPGFGPLAGEFVVDQQWSQDILGPAYFNYQMWSEGQQVIIGLLALVPNRRDRTGHGRAPTYPVCFRLVFPDDQPDVYEELANNPISRDPIFRDR